jgi:hypothetical protein
MSLTIQILVMLNEMLLNDAVVPAFTANKTIKHGFSEHSLNTELDPAVCDINQTCLSWD